MVSVVAVGMQEPASVGVIDRDRPERIDGRCCCCQLVGAVGTDEGLAVDVSKDGFVGAVFRSWSAKPCFGSGAVAEVWDIDSEFLAGSDNRLGWPSFRRVSG